VFGLELLLGKPFDLAWGPVVVEEGPALAVDL
jgi:hypothetical protein